MKIEYMHIFHYVKSVEIKILSLLFKKSFVIISAILLLSSVAYSGDRSNARSTAMAFSNTVSSFGNDAYGINPANFDYYRPVKLSKKKRNSADKTIKLKPRWEISLFSTGGGYGSDSSIAFYNDYLQYLSIDRNKFVSLFTNIEEVLKFRNEVLPGEQTDVNYDFELNWLSVNYMDPKIGAINVSISDKVGLNTNVYSRDEYLPLNFGFVVHPDFSYDLTNVNLAQSEAIAWWIRKYNVGYAKRFEFGSKNAIKSFSIGVAGGLVHGFGNVSTYESRLNISSWGIKDVNGVNHVDSIVGKQDFHTKSSLTDFFEDYKDGAEAQLNLFPKPAGVGYSFDLGIAMQIGNEWKLAASVSDLGKITWDYNTIINDDTNYFAYYDFDITGTDPTYNAMVDDLGGYHTQDSTTHFTSEMPTKFRAGLMFQPSGRFLIEFNWSKGLNNLPGNTDMHVFALGSEYFPLPYLPVRAGVSVGGPGAFYVSLGMGVKFERMTIDIGTHGINQLIQDKRFSVSLSSRIIF
jgi:Family of unknown function (DUF5723)